MSDSDDCDAEAFDDYDDDIEQDRQLISYVRNNKFLYDKTEKLYLNIDVKNNVWAKIDRALDYPEGQSSKRFYAIRQRFGKERRKILKSMPMSGAGTDQPRYQSTWLLYKDCLFLTDIIKPRKTVSNYATKVATNSQKHNLDSSVPSKCFSQSVLNSSFSEKFPISIDLSASFSDTENDFLLQTSLDKSPKKKILQNITKKTDNENNVLSQGNTQRKKILQSMAKITTKRTVPPSDYNYKKKRPDADVVGLTEQTSLLSNIAKNISDNMSAQRVQHAAAATNDTSPSIEAMLVAIKFALHAVPENEQLQCLIGLLKYIHDHSYLNNA